MELKYNFENLLKEMLFDYTTHLASAFAQNRYDFKHNNQRIHFFTDKKHDMCKNTKMHSLYLYFSDEEIFLVNQKLVNELNGQNNEYWTELLDYLPQSDWWVFKQEILEINKVIVL